MVDSPLRDYIARRRAEIMPKYERLKSDFDAVRRELDEVQRELNELSLAESAVSTAAKRANSLGAVSGPLGYYGGGPGTGKKLYDADFLYRSPQLVGDAVVSRDVEPGYNLLNNFLTHPTHLGSSVCYPLNPVPAEPKLTIKQMVVTLLMNYRNGLDTNSIIKGIKIIFNHDVPRSSMSPQLSRLKSEGTLILDGNIWRLEPDYLQNETPPEDQSEGVYVERTEVEDDLPF